MSSQLWQWNEIQQLGTDYSDVSEVERYEKRMGEFRDLAADAAVILSTLGLAEHSHILEIGTGTGHFARAAARAGHRVTALDVSLPMLQYAEAKAKTEGLDRIDFRHAGFLTYDGASGTFDAAVSVAVLHHLPDLWKYVAMQNIRRVLKPGGKYLLGDVVFSSNDDLQKQFDEFIGSMTENMRKGAIGHITREFSTIDWIMEGILERAGFEIMQIDAQKTPLIQYLSRVRGG